MEKRIRILSVIDGLGFAGDESRLLSFGQTLNRERFAHSVLTLNPSAYSKMEQFHARRKQFLDAGILVQDLSDFGNRSFPGLGMLPPPIYRKTGILRRAWALSKVARELDVSVLDGHLNSAGLVTAFAGHIARIPSSVTLYCGIQKGNRVIWPRSTRLTLRLTDGVLTDSEVRANEMRALISNRSAKIRVIPNGIAEPRSERSPLEMRSLLGLPSDPTIRVIGMIARFVEYKGHRVLLKAAQKVLAQQPNVVFLAIGFTPSEAYRDSLKQLARDLGIADRVVLTEYEGEIGDVWKIVDIHAHASLFDSLPISIAEGMSLGKPAVVTSTGGVPEIVHHGTTGLVVPPGDADAIASALIRLLTDPALARSLGTRARERYERLYQPQTMTQAMELFFSNLARRKGRGRDGHC